MSGAKETACITSPASRLCERCRFGMQATLSGYAQLTPSVSLLLASFQLYPLPYPLLTSLPCLLRCRRLLLVLFTASMQRTLFTNCSVEIPFSHCNGSLRLCLPEILSLTQYSLYISHDLLPCDGPDIDLLPSLRYLRPGDTRQSFYRPCSILFNSLPRSLVYFVPVHWRI